MGKVVHMDKVREFIAKTPVFRVRDIRMIVRDGEYTSLLLHNLTRSGEVRRITKGWYSAREDPLVSVFAFRPAYLGLQEALSLRHLWEQETNVVLVTPLKVRPGTRTVMESQVIIHRIKREYFFGFEYLKYGDIVVPVSDTEKTLIDLAYFNEAPAKYVLEGMVDSVDPLKLRRYLKPYREDFRRRVGALVSAAR